MEIYRLSFCIIHKHSDNIAEVIIDRDIEVKIEMVEEFDIFLSNIFQQDFGVLVNKINQYSYAFDAQLMLVSLETMRAIATVNYSGEGHKSTQEFIKRRCIDNLNVKTFSGYELGWQEGYDWLLTELG